MAALTKTIVTGGATTAIFRDWGEAISDQLVAGGWVQTVDTGQIDWTTVIWPGSANQTAGYEIFRSNDGGAGKTEIYFKITYMSGTSQVTFLRLSVQVGFASDGTGNLTGPVSSIPNATQASATAANDVLNVSAGAGWQSVSIFSNTAQARNLIWSVERPLKADGSFEDVVLLCFSGAGSHITSQVVSPAAAYPIQTSPFAQIQYNHTNGVVNMKGGMSLQVGQRGGATGPSINIFGVSQTAYGSAQSMLKLTHHGVEHTYVNLGSLSTLFCSGQGFLLRYE